MRALQGLGSGPGLARAPHEEDARLYPSFLLDIPGFMAMTLYPNQPQPYSSVLSQEKFPSTKAKKPQKAQGGWISS